MVQNQNRTWRQGLILSRFQTWWRVRWTDNHDWCPQLTLKSALGCETDYWGGLDPSSSELTITNVGECWDLQQAPVWRNATMLPAQMYERGHRKTFRERNMRVVFVHAWTPRCTKKEMFVWHKGDLLLWWCSPKALWSWNPTTKMSRHSFLHVHRIIICNLHLYLFLYFKIVAQRTSGQVKVVHVNGECRRMFYSHVLGCPMEEDLNLARPLFPSG